MILKHHKALNGTVQAALPRYRKRGAGDKTYVFAAYCKPLKEWLVIDETWGFMPPAEFELDYIPSNDEARRTFKSEKDRHASDSEQGAGGEGP